MKIIHCADLHLDSSMQSNLSKEKAKERKGELLKTYSDMVDYAVANGVTAILIAGDLFDTGNVSATARNTVKDSIIAHSDIHFYLLKGNHDRDNFLTSLEEIPDNLHLFDKEWTQYSLGKNGNIKLFGLEFDKENIGDIYIPLQPAHGDYNIVMLHGQETDTGAKDKAEIINLKALRNRNIDYLALGHIHEYKESALDTRGVYCYPGCLESRGFDETGRHGFVVLDIDEETLQCSRTLIESGCRQNVVLSVDVSGCMSTVQALDVIDRKLDETTVNCRNLLKIELVGNVDIEAEIDAEYIAKKYEDDFFFVKVKDKTGTHVDYADYRFDASLKGEFVRTVMEDEALSEEDKANIIRIGIRALAGEEVTL